MALTSAPTEAPAKPECRIRFDRNEFSGAFGDMGTDFPLIAGMILAAGLNPASVLTLFGSMQILTGLLYGIPMPAQPLKAMAVIVISQKASGAMLYGAGLAIGLVMLVLAGTGLLGVLANAVPKSVVRGIQFGLGLQLATLLIGAVPKRVVRDKLPTLPTGEVDDVVREIRYAVTSQWMDLHGRAGYLDTRGWFCDGFMCPFVVGHIIVYRDTGHVTQTYAKQLAVPFRNAFRRCLFSNCPA